MALSPTTEAVKESLWIKGYIAQMPFVCRYIIIRCSQFIFLSNLFKHDAPFTCFFSMAQTIPFFMYPGLTLMRINGLK